MNYSYRDLVPPWYVTPIKQRDFDDQQCELSKSVLADGVATLHGYTALANRWQIMPMFGPRANPTTVLSRRTARRSPHRQEMSTESKLRSPRYGLP